MGLLDEAGLSQLAAALQQGVGSISSDAEIEFQAYTRVVLPLDGYVFWLPTTPLCVFGSLHISQDIIQNEDETLGLATVVFTSKSPVTQFSESPINILYVASFGEMRYAFSSQKVYQQAGIWHYIGHSIQPALASQLLDDPASIDPNQAVVSNSLPLWLSLNDYVCPYFDGFSNSIPLFPSFITPPNLTPAYGAVHIGEDDTRPLASAPTIDANRNHSQWCADIVRITLFGLQNNAALDFVDCVMQWSVDTGNFGIMNMPVIRDAKRTQAEMLAIAMKKVVEFEVSYEQSRVANIARNLIEQALVTFIFPTYGTASLGQAIVTQGGLQIDTQDGQYLETS